jgi:predicted MFS family arabinose efflux permease
MVIRAKAATDIAQSMLVTVWNLAIAGGGVLGGIVLQHTGTGGFHPYCCYCWPWRWGWHG